LRKIYGERTLPRTVNMISGPSRTADYRADDRQRCARSPPPLCLDPGLKHAGGPRKARFPAALSPSAHFRSLIRSVMVQQSPTVD
jgi:hypothetical protein